MSKAEDTFSKCKLHFGGRGSGSSVWFGAIEQIIVIDSSDEVADGELYKVVISSLLKNAPEEYTEVARVSSKLNAFDLVDALICGYCQYYGYDDCFLRWSSPRRKKLDPKPYLARANHAFYTGEWSGVLDEDSGEIGTFAIQIKGEAERNDD